MFTLFFSKQMNVAVEFQKDKKAHKYNSIIKVTYNESYDKREDYQ